ncbi:MAG: HAMP domain-containing sensor histidine kinase [Arenibacter sp.]|uniref:sensor histidine kinase n=1 Tax=Arenibacter lacus TaxID=2608629 RepID=UPI00123E1757|nr:HAMP domain-containing sensor histidine kinase [Arenibacter lacus]MDX1328168.1 HAMP domain-containing sensor histidine kinase [Arenibacter sp.]
MAVNPAEEKLKERIKELTCMYEVTSIIVNCDYDQMEDALKGIMRCLQKAFRHNKDAHIALVTDQYSMKTDQFPQRNVALKSNVEVFNKKVGYIQVAYPSPSYAVSNFLLEEKKLLQNICMEVGNLLERKQIKDKEDLVKRKMEHTDRLSILGEITAGMAHELNTPLANILGFSELLKARIKEDSEANRDLDKIINSAIFSREVVKKLMFFACEMPQQMDLVNIVPIVSDAFNLMQPSLKSKKIKGELSFSGESIFLRVDAIQLTQVVFNLMLNAIYFAPQRSVIRLFITEKEDGVEMLIEDQGPGIAPSIREKVFEPFYSTKPTGEGSGLGLSVVHGIVKSHRGTIEYRPNIPKGTIFVIQFPKK